MRTALWHDQTEADMHAWIARTQSQTSPAATILATTDQGIPIGFVEAGTRSHADGCESSPVAYIEGWYVDPDHRRRGVGAELIRAAEAWARAQGLTELASDAELENERSQRAHESLGFQETDRVVLYTKRL